MDNLDFILSLFSQYLFTTAKENIQDIEYYFTTNPNTRDNALIKELLYALKTYNLENIDVPLFQSICSKAGKNTVESKEILDKLIQWKSYDREKMEPARKYLEDLCSASVIQRANHLYPNDPTQFLHYLKKAEIKVNKVQDVLTTSSFNDLDINSLIADETTCGVPSYFDFINNSFEPHRSIEFGQIGLISMPPGTGKSLMAMCEALNFASRGIKTHYAAFGDLKFSDFIIRLCAIWSGLPFWEARKNIVPIYKSLCEAVGDNLGITCLPSGTVTAEEYVEYIKNSDYRCCILDYDGTLKNPGASDSLYLSYGAIYDKLTELSAMGKLILILAQPQKPSWELEEIELHQVGESAKKIMTVDWAVTRGRCTESENHLGVFTIIKNRRGEEGGKAYSVRLNNGRFKIIPRQVYNELKKVEGKANWSEGEIDQMIAEYERTKGMIQSHINNGGNPQGNGGGLGLTPFGKK